jgi:hypothetical protein
MLPEKARRIKVNATISCIKSGTDFSIFQAFFDKLKASADDLDNLAWVYAQGELKRTESIEEIKMISKRIASGEMTCLIALLKLGDISTLDMSASLYDQFEEERRIEFIHQLSRVKDQESRLKFYQALILQKPELSKDLMEKITYSKRDFDDDLSRILFSLREKGIEVGRMKITRFAHYS